MSDEHFINKVYELISQAIDELPQGKLWSIQKEQRLSTAQGTYRTDISISYKGSTTIAVECKRKFNPIIARRSQIVFSYGIPYFMFCMPEGFDLFSAKNPVKNFKFSKPQHQLSPKSLRDVLENIENRLKESQGSETSLIQSICETWSAILDKADSKPAHWLDVQKFISRLTADNVHSDVNNFWLDEDAENNLFRNLLGQYSKNKLCRFVALQSLFRTCSTAEQGMCCIVCMNDKSEVNYVTRKFNYPIDYDEINRCYIISCSDIAMANDFTMLRLYADDARGACIEYEIANVDPKFIIAPVSYALDHAQTHPELDFISSIQSTPVNGKTLKLKTFGIWQHFFKPYEYAYEHEVRLLCYDKGDTKKRIWILDSTYQIISPLITFDITQASNQFPLVISKITLGPKTADSEINAIELARMIADKQIIVSHLTTTHLVEQSKVTHYR